MKHFAKIISAVLVLIMVFAQSAAALPFDFTDGYVNSDSEGYSEGFYYYAGSSDTGFAYRETSPLENRETLTDYNVSSIAVFDGNLYSLCDKTIRKTSLKNGEDIKVYSSRKGIDRFAVTADGLYMLINGSIVLLPEGKTELSVIVASGKIDTFWLEGRYSICYMPGNNRVHYLSLTDGTERIETDNSSSLGDAIPLYDNTAGGTISPAGADIGTLQRKFPAGKYWNHVGSSRNNPDGYTSSPCTHHKNCDYSGSCGCNSFNSAIQCMGYAYKCAYDVTGSYPANWSRITSASSLNDLKAGDIIRYRGDGHSIYVIGVRGDTVTITDCNWDNQCGIRWGATLSKSTIRSTFTYLKSSPFEAPGNYSEETKYTVTFNANSGYTPVTIMTVVSGEKYGKLPAAEKEGYTLDGWFTQASGGTQITEDSTVTGDITLYAHWTIITYYITFDNRGGVYQPADFTKVWGESKTIDSRSPSRSGYQFIEWNTAADGSGTGYKPRSVYSANENATLYAIWQGNTCYLYFYPEGGKVDNDIKAVIYGDPYGELPVPTREGYDFTGWHINSASGEKVDSSTIVTFNGSLRLYASWEVIKYRITYNANGGKNAPDSQIKEYGSLIYLSNSVPTRENYNFTGWWTRADGTGTKYNPGDIYNTNAHLDLYAGWQGDRYTVSFNANGGENAPKSVTKYYGTPITLPSDVPERTGFDFTGWNTKQDGTGTAFAAGGNYDLKGNTTLYAQWETAKYKVTYNALGGTGAPETQVFIYDSSTVISTVKPSKTGHIFKGWSKTEGSNTVDYNGGETYAENASLTLYAVWEREKYNVSYNSNSGNAFNVTQVKEYGIPLNLTASVPTKTGYNFLRWNTRSDGSGTDYAPGSVYEKNEPVTLYALWAPAVYRVTFDPCAPGIAKTYQSFTYDTVYGTLPDARRTGYTFDGWWTLQTGGKQIKSTDTVRITSGTVFYAHWSPLSYNASLNPAGGTVSVRSVSVQYRQPYGELPVPERDGYVFAGWFDEEGNEAAPDSIMKYAHSISLTARWIKGVYTVTLDPAGGNLDNVSLQKEQGKKVSDLPSPEKAGYKFTGWLDESGNAVESFTMPGRNVTLTASYERESITIAFNGYDYPPVTAYYGEKTGALPCPEKDNSVFLGWFDANSNEINENTVCTYDSDITVSAAFADISGNTNIYTNEGKTLYTYPLSDTTVPAVPEKAGYSGVWQLIYSDSTCRIYEPDYSPETYNAGFIIDGKTVNIAVPCGEKIETPDISIPDGMVFTGYEPAVPAAMPAQDLEFTAVFMAAERTVLFMNGGELWSSAVTENGTYILPETPVKAGYEVSWKDISTESGPVTMAAVYTPITYKAHFKASGNEIAAVDFNLDSEGIIEPDIPQISGYSAKWEEYSIVPDDITINAVYTPNIYHVTFRANGEIVEIVSYSYGVKSIKEPKVPEKSGYTGKWSAYNLSYADSVSDAVYSPVTYFATFVANGNVISRVPFTVESAPAEPAIPFKRGYTARWSSYEIIPSDITVTAVYSPQATVSIVNYIENRPLDYLTTITFRSSVTNPPDNYEIHWIINGNDEGTGNGDGTFTMRNADKDFTVKCQLYSDGIAGNESREEKVDVNDTFFGKLIGFIRRIFNRLHKVTQ